MTAGDYYSLFNFYGYWPIVQVWLRGMERDALDPSLTAGDL